MQTAAQLIQKLGIENVDPQKQDEILQDLANSVSNRILLGISEKLSDEDLKEVTDLLDSDKEAEVENLLAAKIDDFEGFKARIEQETIDEIAKNIRAVNDQVTAVQNESLNA